jgi:hypothetical protein
VSDRVSVVLTTYNGERWLPEALDSALAQTHPDVEVIVVDDGSTDGTAEVIERYEGRVRTIHQRNGGLAAARNAGVAAATGRYIALLDHDDLWHADALAVQVEVAGRHPSSGMVVCDASEFDADGTVRDHLFATSLRERLERSERGELTLDLHRTLIRGNIIGCPAQTLIPRTVLDAIGPFRDSGAQDYDCYLRIAQRHPIALHRATLARWRQLPSSMSGPTDRRHFTWALDTAPVLVAHRGRCHGVDAAAVTVSLQRLVLLRSWQAFRVGIGSDRAYAETFLRSMAAGGQPVAAVTSWLLRRVPDQLIRLLRRGRRQRAGGRRCRPRPSRTRRGWR